MVGSPFVRWLAEGHLYSHVPWSARLSNSAAPKIGAPKSTLKTPGWCL